MLDQPLTRRQAIATLLMFSFGSSVVLGVSTGVAQDSWISLALATLSALPMMLMYLSRHPFHSFGYAQPFLRVQLSNDGRIHIRKNHSHQPGKIHCHAFGQIGRLDLPGVKHFQPIKRHRGIAHGCHRFGCRPIIFEFHVLLMCYL